jgi:hypothetical protein
VKYIFISMSFKFFVFNKFQAKSCIYLDRISRGYSCTDSIFTIRHIAEETIEYNSPVYICFIDLDEVFDNLNSVLEVLD